MTCMLSTVTVVLDLCGYIVHRSEQFVCISGSALRHASIVISINGLVSYFVIPMTLSRTCQRSDQHTLARDGYLSLLLVCNSARPIIFIVPSYVTLKELSPYRPSLGYSFYSHLSPPLVVAFPSILGPVVLSAHEVRGTTSYFLNVSSAVLVCRIDSRRRAAALGLPSFDRIHPWLWYFLLERCVVNSFRPWL